MNELSLHLMDIMQNSIAAGAGKIIVCIKADTIKDRLDISVKDDGKGMDEDMLKSITDPFVTSRKERKIGLGIPLFKDAAEITGGGLTIKSQLGKGTVINAEFVISSIDRLPLGDVAGTFVSTIAAKPDTDYELNVWSKKGKFCFRTEDARQKLGEVPIYEFEVLSWIKDYINEGIVEILGGALNEIDG